MPGLADAFRMPAQWPPQPRALDEDQLMPVPQMAPQPFGLGALLQQPTYTPQHHQGFLSPGFADFLRNHYFNRQGI